MTTYDFSRLSSLDFEELVHDLLSAEWQIRLETFTSGRDGGIDLRHTGVGHTIVQCKHYAASGFTALLNHLRHKELPKVEKLAPQRYVLVTSVPLTPPNKDQLISAMAPFIKATSDIIGGTEIEGLLRRHGDIEKTHYKLWLTSTAVLGGVDGLPHLAETGFPN